MKIEEDLVNDYRQWLNSWDASASTIAARTTVARSRLREWGIDGFTSENVTAWLARPELKSKWSKATYHNHLTCLCAWLTASGRIGSNPMLNVKKTRRPENSPRPLSEQEVTRVLSVAQGDVRDWILLALYEGLRASEVAKIRGEDVTADGLFVDGKGGKKVTLPTHAEIWDMAQRKPQIGYWFAGPDDGHFRSQQISLIVGRFFKALGIKGSIHRCRHVYGTRLLRAGVNVRTVQKLMRHSSLDTTAAYTAVDEDELRAAINLLGPAA